MKIIQKLLSLNDLILITTNYLTKKIKNGFAIVKKNTTLLKNL